MEPQEKKKGFNEPQATKPKADENAGVKSDEAKALAPGPTAPAWATGTGALLLALAGAKKSAFATSHVPRPASLECEATFPGTFTEYVEKRSHELKSDSVALTRFLKQTKNEVKKCPCGKPNGYTLTNCNACGASLEAIEVSFTNNVFVGFICGVGRGPFPLTVSMRLQTKSFMVFDDLLALSACHLICIPTEVYVPDLRCLFLDPPRGLALLRKMKALTSKVAREQFLTNPAWQQKCRSSGLSAEQLLEHVCIGLNFPPAQYQLHLQFIMPPLFPQHWQLYCQGIHFTPGRYIPLEYLEAALSSKQGATLPNAPTMSLEAITSHVERKCNVSYEAMHKSAFARYGASQSVLANHASADFEALILEGHTVLAGSPLHEAGTDAKTLQAADKLVLQNYGRPYKANGRPSGTHYKFAKQAPLKDW